MRLTELYKVFDQKILSQANEKYVNVKTNPFAKDALKESLDLNQFQKNLMKFDVLVDSAKKFSEVFSKDMDFIKTKLEAATEDSKEIKLNYG